MNRRPRESKGIPPSPKGGFGQAHAQWRAASPRRRDFLALMGLVTATLVLPVQAKNRKPAQARPHGQDNEPWKTLAAVQQHLLPSEDHAPGAKDIHATSYLKNLVTGHAIGEEERNFITSGPGWLNDLAMQQHKAVFVRLTENQQTDLLQQIARTSAGEDWLAMLLTYIFEALLSSPIYGGNPGAIGWQWLQHDPGFPLPATAGQTWQALQKRR